MLQTITTSPDLNRIPVIILTTSRAADAAQAYDYHANSYLVKPVEFSDLVALMRELDCYWLDWNTRPREQAG